MPKRLLVVAPLGLALLCLLSAAAYNLPPIHSRLAWRVERLQTQIKYALNPPEEVVFVPQGFSSEQQAQVDAMLESTMAAIVDATITALIPTPQAPGPSQTPLSTATPSPTPTRPPTPIPEQVVLSGIPHEYEKMNNCGPATLSMNLAYWGWQGDQLVTRAYLRPNTQVDDKNVMLSEMEKYVETQTGLKALVRAGGNLDLLKRLVAAGLPVIVEKGFQPGKESWMGHYALINGYDDGLGRFITQDSYIMPDFPLPYKDLEQRWWRDFNYVYMVVYPPEREADVLAILGPQADEILNFRHALQKADEEIQTLSGRDLFFAWYNRGTNLVALQDYAAAAEAYDQAFALYPALSEKERPWRMLWYQIGPYPAYFHTGRYQDVINLADTTFQWIGQPVLEETFYWRGLAYEALGNQEKAISDLEKAANLNPTSTDAVDHLRRLGVEIP
jgi:hypothetical protein